MYYVLSSAERLEVLKFKQSAISSITYEEVIVEAVRPSTITKKSSPLKPLDQLRPNFDGMVLG